MSERPGTLVATGFALGAMAGAIGALMMWVLLSLNETDLAIMKVIAPALILGCGLALATVNLGRYQAVLLQNLDPDRYTLPPEEPYSGGTPLGDSCVDQRTGREFEEQYAGSFEDVPAPPDDIATLTIEIARCAMQQAVWYYNNSENPTREVFTAREQVSQPIWNSGRFVLKTIGIVSETGTWAAIEHAAAMGLFARVKCEKDKIWVPVLGKIGQYKIVSIRTQLTDNSHASIGPPHSLGG